MFLRKLSVFNPKMNTKNFHTQNDVIKTSKKINELYRAQELNSFFSIPTFILGVFATIQYETLQGSHIVKHQKSTRLVGTTSEIRIAYHLEKSWNLGGILTIDPKFVIDYTLDVSETVKRHGTNYYTAINEFEHCMTVLPVCAIKTITLKKQNKIVRNPFYIDSQSPEVIEEYKPVYQAHLKLLQTLFDQGEEMSSEIRQAEINKLMEIYNDFYQKHLGNKNPLLMTISQFKKIFGEDFFDYHSHDEPIQNLISRHGDKHFNEWPRYKHLLIKKKIDEYDDVAYERHSYQYE